MKTIAIALIMLAALVLIAPGTAMNETTNAYIEGVHYGLSLMAAQENVTAYNALVKGYNDWLNATLPAEEARKEWLAQKSAQKPDVADGNQFEKDPFKDNSQLSQFGKGAVKEANPDVNQDIAEADAADKVLKDFI